MQSDKWVRVVPMTAWLVPAIHHYDAGFGIGEKRVSEGHCDSAASHDHIISFECAFCHLTTFNWNDKSGCLRHASRSQCESPIPQLRTFSSVHKISHRQHCWPAMSGSGHVWAAFWQELSDVSAALVGCGHVSGLSMRHVWPLALMLRADWVRNKNAH